jgi:acyl carrier protein
MANKLEELRQALEGTDDSPVISWFIEIARTTPDVYVRTASGGVNAGTHLQNELGIDSIGKLCVFYSLVDALGTEDEETAVAEWSTVGDVLAFLRSRASRT